MSRPRCDLRLVKVMFEVFVRAFSARRDLLLENLAFRISATTRSLSSTPTAAKIFEWRPISLDCSAPLLVRVAEGVDPGGPRPSITVCPQCSARDQLG